MRDRIRRAVGRLEAAFGEPVWQGRKDPLSTLVGTILSQNTTDVNRDRAWDAMRQRYPGWEDVLSGTEEELRDVIKVAGLGNQRSKRIMALLSWVKGRFGGFNVSEMCEWSLNKAIRELGGLPGIGIKTISVMLLFACGQDLCPVDTHVYRVVGRLGWAGNPGSRDKMFHRLQGQFPTGKGYSLHINLIQLGRRICKPRDPKCGECPLNGDCDHFRDLGD
jgi:endonuclease-3